jgi:succinate dehydrogenase/fumarate reductase cytochrome b subunit (b558 family)
MRLLGERVTLARLHSLSGVLPLGVFLIVHFAINARALQGRAAFDGTLAALRGMPLLGVLELALIGLPLAFHAGYGVVLSFRPREPASPYPRRLGTLERATGIVALVFIAFHFYELRGPLLWGSLSEADVYPRLAARLSSTTAWGVPAYALFHLVGVAATVFHFATGLYAFSVRWGVAEGARATRTAARVCAGGGVFLFLIGAATVVYYATGSRFFFAG